MNQSPNILVFHQVLDNTRADCVFEFHKDHIGEYIWPRTLDDFRQLANDGCLYAAYEQSGTQPAKEVGVCYIMDGEDLTGNPRREFGGIYVSDDCRGAGVASALGTIAISNYYVWDPLRHDQRGHEKLIAHVHELNDLPRRLLDTRLGFRESGQQETPPVEPPQNMRRNAEGKVVGDLFEFDKSKLLEFADWLESFGGNLTGKSGQKIARIEVPAVKTYLKETLEALRDFGSDSPYSK